MSYDVWIPLVTWQTADDITLEVSTDNATWSEITIGSGKYGFGADSVAAISGSRVIWTASSDSLAGAIGAAAASALSLSGVESEYCTGTGAIQVAWRIQHATSSIYIRGTSTAMALVGLYPSTSFRMRPANDVLLSWSNRNWTAIFSPHCPAANFRPIPKRITRQAANVFNPLVSQTTRLGSATVHAVTWDVVATRYMNATTAADAIYADAVSTSTDDTQNTLERLTDAASLGNYLKLYLRNSSTTGIDCRLEFDSDLREEDYAEETDNGRTYRINLRFVAA